MSAVDDYETLLIAKREKLNRGNDGSMVSLFLKGFKTTGIAIAVWCWGYLGMSVAWIFVLLFFHIVSDEVSKQIKSKRKYALQAMSSEKNAILSRVDKSQASWIYFPEIERAEWLNKMVKQLWPVIAEYIENLILTTIESSIQGYMPSSLGVFKFNNVDMGDIPIRIEGVQVFIDPKKKNEIIVDVKLRYAGDANITCTVKGINFGIKSLRISGNLRCIINPLISDVPIIGGLTVFFLSCPDISFDMTAAANILDLPVIKKTISDIICKVVSDICVLPRRIPVSLHPSVDATKIKYPPPEGLVIIHILEGKDLTSADINIIGKGKSDPYCKVTVGNQLMRTRTIQSSLNPVWDQYFQAVVDQTHGQLIDIRVFDEDSGSATDDPLGNATLDVEMISAKKNVEIWLPLANAPSGSLHLRALWLAVSNKMEDYKPRERTGTISDSFATSILMVVVDGAKMIPKSLNTGKARNTYVKLKMDGDSRRTTIKYNTEDPIWGENFNFFIADPQNQQMELELVHKGSSKETTLATLMVPVNSVLLTKDLSLTKDFNLVEVDKNCTLTIRFILRVLKSTVTPSSWSELSGSAAMSFGNAMKQQFSFNDTQGNNSNDNTFTIGLGNNMGLENVGKTNDFASARGEGGKNLLHDDNLLQSATDKKVAMKDIDDDDEEKPAKILQPLVPEVPTVQPSGSIGDIKKESRKSDNFDDNSQNFGGNTQNLYEPPHPSQQLPFFQPSTTLPKQPTPSFQPSTTLPKQPTPSPPQATKFPSISQPSVTGQNKPIDVVPPKKTPSKFGQIQLTVRHSSNRNKLVVVVHQCKNLIPCDKDNLADPYVRMYLLPDRSPDSKKKTRLIKNTLDPTFDETFEWDIGAMECPFRTLEVAVKNDVGMFSKSRTEMGIITIELSTLGDINQAITQWFDLEDPKGH